MVIVVAPICYRFPAHGELCNKSCLPHGKQACLRTSYQGKLSCMHNGHFIMVIHAFLKLAECCCRSNPSSTYWSSCNAASDVISYATPTERLKGSLADYRDSLMQEVQIQHEAVTGLNLKLTDAQKKCQGLEAQLQQLKEAQAVSYSFARKT